MAFVNEKMTKEEMEEFAARKIPFPGMYIGCHTLSPSQWTIDSEENIFLIWGWCEGRRDLPDNINFLLVWKGANIPVRLKESWTKSTCNWELLNIDIPRELKEKRGEIIQSLKDALIVYGFDGDPDDKERNKRTIVEFSNI